ncbi:hypothetical protein ABIG06_002275 [Bradyrhizobium sp. USDA 326]
MSNAVANGATGAGLFSSSSHKQESGADACQPGSARSERSACSGIPVPGAVSRRSLMNVFVGAAAVAGAAIPPSLLAAKPAPNVREVPPVIANPDAELLSLGKQYERLLREEATFRRKSRRLHAATEARRDEIFGRDFACTEERRRTLSTEEFREWHGAWETASTETGHRAAHGAWCAACKRTRVVGRKILRIKAATLAGLLVRSRVLTTNGELLCRGEPIEQLEREIRAFALRCQA